jgi:cytochrome c-type biogenesis protein CcmH/NrfG
MVAAAAATFFLVHPIQTQAVTYITQRFESLATLFMLAAALSYVRFRRTERWQWLAATLASGAAAGLTKETAVVLPLWLLLIELVFFDGKARIRRALYLVAPLGLAVLYPAWIAFRSSDTTLTWAAWDRYFLTQGAVLTKYLTLSAWPDQQFLFYDFPLVEGFSWGIVLHWAFVLGVIALGVFCAKRGSTIGFGILTFFVLLLPVTVIPLPDLIVEHRIYPAFAGLALAAAALCQVDRRKSVWLAVVVLTVMWSLKTVQRNSDWNDEIAFLEQHRARFPQHPDVLMRLGSYYFTRGAVNKALELTQEAQRSEQRLNVYYRNTAQVLIACNLAFLYLAKSDTASALIQARRAAVLDPDHSLVLMTLGSVNLEAGDYQGAHAALKTLTEKDPSNVQAWEKLSVVLSKLGDASGAEAARLRAGQETENQNRIASRHRQIPMEYKNHVVFGFVFLMLVAAAAAIRTIRGQVWH